MQNFWVAVGLRAVQSAVVVWIVLSAVFVVTRMVGDPVTVLAPMSATQADIHRLKGELGLNDPLYEQYARYMRDVAELRLGTSFRTGQPAVNEVKVRLPATLELSVSALALAVLLGVPAGVLAAMKRGTVLDGAARLFALLGQAVPNFWLGIMLVLLFSVKLGWLPTGGTGGLSHLILPAFTLGAVSSAAITRLTRSGMLDVLGADFVRTARAKGLPERRVILRHALRHALMPVVTILGIQVGLVFAGTIVVETVFAWPGMGRLLIQSIQSADYPVVQVGVLLTATAIVLANMLVDLSYRLIDPRVQGAL